jgi:hypothetical protein
MEALVSKPLHGLKNYIKIERSVGGFPNDTPLEDGHSVDVLSSTFADDRII